MAPVRNPSSSTGTVPKSTSSGSMCSSTGLSHLSDSNLQQASSRFGYFGSSCTSSVGACNSNTGKRDTLSGENYSTEMMTSGENYNLSGPTSNQSGALQSGGISAAGGTMANAFASRKNTEIVAPIRRELKDLNDYFLTVAEPPKTNKRLNHHYHHRHQQPVEPLAGSSGLDRTTCFEIGNEEAIEYNDSNTSNNNDNRSCYPVRPIPRHSIQTRSNDVNFCRTNSHSPHQSCTASTSNQVPTVGIVNPTALGTTKEGSKHNHRRATSVHLKQKKPESSPINIADFENFLLQRYKYIQQCIKLANKAQNKNKDNMVNENNEQDFLVNSASLEDVVTNEPGEQRAQSVTSIHSSTDPPTPSYEDIHARLEASNRNIQNMKEQQQQLQRLQDQAKQHLAEMEALRDRTAAQQRTTQNGDMQFESMDDVHTNMSSLVGRMKNLTAFIQGQNELTNLLGDDGPDVLAEQQTLQQKLEDLKSHRDEMKNLILELHEVNSLSEKRANESKSQTQHDNRTQEEAVEQDSQARAVPMEYSRIVPIELVENQQHNKRHARPSRPDNNAMSNDSDAPQSSEDEIIEDPATIALLQQKMSDIQAMKNQLTRLKSMMETVKLIEDRTGGLDPRDIGYSDAGTKGPVEEVKQRSSPPKRESPPKNTNTQQRPYSSAVPFDKDRTPIPEDFATQLTNDPDINGKIEALNEVTRDLRSQATSLANERSRIRVLKEEIMRRKAGNAPAATSSNTPENKIFKKDGVSPLNQRNSNGDVDITKIQFDGKKKEFQNLCHHMQANENSADQRAEEDEEIEEDDESDNKQEKHAHKPATNYFASQPQNLSCMSSPRSSIAPTHMKESIDSVAAEANACIPCDVDSFKSSSSRSYSMPPPMRSINNRENTWRKTVPETYDHHANQNFSMPTGSSGIFPQAWNPYYFYNSQCSQHVTPVQNTGTDCNCSMNANPSGTSAPPGGSNQSFADPIILQQFAQTQQMLINSVCQCNQMLWHQQREINTISNALHTLQEQFQNHINNSDMTANIRSESVPPVSTVQNNLCLNQNRAHSEQPHQFSTPHPHYVHHSPPLMTPHAMNSTNFHRRNFCNFHQQQGTSSYNFAMEQQSAGSAFAAGVTAACNSMQHSYNNLSNGGTTFMHHHNNTLHPGQNNHSNLQNAAQQPQQGQQTTVTSNSQQVNVSSAGSNINGLALNNQVPPGNRANNYWDNFRSYSRQNLLSSNSCKSNEEQNYNHHQQLQQQHQQNHQHHQPPQQQQSQQPQAHQEDTPLSLPIFTNSLNAIYRPDTLNNTNNLNHLTTDQKHTFRNRINVNSTGHNDSNLLNTLPLNSSLSSQGTNSISMTNTAFNVHDSQQPDGNPHSVDVINEAFEPIDLVHDLRNMNLNFGNNELNKVPAKHSSLRRPLATDISRQGQGYQFHPDSTPSDDRSFQQSDTAADILSAAVLSGIMQSLGWGTDHTSDEMKRNLLVNTLKNEKFTTKFYESLKEDVFRRIDTFLRSKDDEQAYPDRNIASSHDPSRKLYLNEVRALNRSAENANDEVGNNDDNENEETNDHDIEGAQALSFSNILHDNSDIQSILGFNPDYLKLIVDKYEHLNPFEKLPIPDDELAHYILIRVYENTQAIKTVNNAVLLDIANITAECVQKCIKYTFKSGTAFTPKTFYKRIKSKEYPRERKAFLSWYKRSLIPIIYDILMQKHAQEGLPQRENNNIIPQNHRNSNSSSWEHIQHQSRKSNISLRSTITASTDSPTPSDVNGKPENTSSLNLQIAPIPDGQETQRQYLTGNSTTTPNTPTNNNLMNEDLAEADQICRSNNVVPESSDSLPDDDFFLCDIYPQPQPALSPDNIENELISISSESQPNNSNSSLMNFLILDPEVNDNSEQAENQHAAHGGNEFTASDHDKAEEDKEDQGEDQSTSYLNGAFGTDPFPYKLDKRSDSL